MIHIIDPFALDKNGIYNSLEVIDIESHNYHLSACKYYKK
jgi:hypothetical protein